MSDYQYLAVSDGTGDASLMHLTANRSTGSTVYPVDSVVGVPTKFIATAGTLLASGFIDPTTETNFKGHVSGATLVVDSFAPGSTDAGNTSGQVVVIKPNTYWAELIAAFIMNATNYGTPENHYVAIMNAASAIISGAVTAASATLSGALTVGANLTVTGQSSVVSASVTSGATITPSSQMYNVTALAVAATIAVPSFTATDGLGVILRIKDTGTAQALTFASGYTNVSGIATPTTTVAGKLLTVGAIYSSATSKWEIQGVNQSA